MPFSILESMPAESSAMLGELGDRHVELAAEVAHLAPDRDLEPALPRLSTPAVRILEFGLPSVALRATAPVGLPGWPCRVGAACASPVAGEAA